MHKIYKLNQKKNIIKYHFNLKNINSFWPLQKNIKVQKFKEERKHLRY
jgi:hypothetical protein